MLALLLELKFPLAVPNAWRVGWLFGNGLFDKLAVGKE